MKVHEQIKFFRKLNGWSQEETASKLDMTRNGYGDIERGETDIPFSRLEQITRIFGVNLIELLGLSEKGVLNLVCEMNKSTWNQGTESSGDYQQLKFDFEKAQLLLTEKDKEIALLKRIIELMEAKNEVTT
jgi:transcriptional regulator with XRE-family HTH domain